jgi:hypothetical protein
VRSRCTGLVLEILDLRAKRRDGEMKEMSKEGAPLAPLRGEDERRGAPCRALIERLLHFGTCC